jgi:hypothetical protein
MDEHHRPESAPHSGWCARWEPSRNLALRLQQIPNHHATPILLRVRESQQRRQTLSRHGVRQAGHQTLAAFQCSRSCRRRGRVSPALASPAANNLEPWLLARRSASRRIRASADRNRRHWLRLRRPFWQSFIPPLTKWVVGCDGGHSVVRERAGIAVEGDTYEKTFILADVEMDWPLDREEVSLFFSEKGLMVVAPLPDNRFRIVARVQQTEQEPSFEEFQNVLDERGPDGSVCRIRSILWSSRFKVAHRVASEFHKGRFLLAGDAAHVHSPAGDQRMNTGIQDGISLAEALQTVLTADDLTPIVEWQNNRRKIAHGVVKITDRMTRMATISSPILKQFRNGLIAVIGHLPLPQHASLKLYRS